MRHKFALVFNNRAGAARPRLLDGVLAGLKSAGAEVFQLPTRSAAEATERVAALALERGADAVIAAGGDGTFRAVATGAAGTELPIGFVPLGTGNVLAYEIGIRKRAAELARGLMDNPVIPIQGGLVNGAPFFLMCGAGFDAEIVQGLNYKTKRLLGRAAYCGPVTKTLVRGPQPFDVDVDGRAYEASWVIVSLASHYGGSFVLTRDTQVGTGGMVAVIIEGRTRAALVAASAALALGRLATAETRPRGVIAVPAHRVRIGQRVSTRIEIDGDDGGLSPVEVVANGPTVRVIVPPRYVADVMNRHTNHVPSRM